MNLAVVVALGFSVAFVKGQFPGNQPTGLSQDESTFCSLSCVQVIFRADCGGLDCTSNFEEELLDHTETACGERCRTAITGVALENCLADHFPEETNIIDSLQPLRNVYESVCEPDMDSLLSESESMAVGSTVGETMN